MRYLINFITIVCFLLSGLIFFRALEIPDVNGGYHASPDVSASIETKPALNEIPAIPEEAEKSPEVEELQAAITDLQAKLIIKEDEIRSIADTEKRPRTLAVLGSGSFSSGQVLINDELKALIDRAVEEILGSSGYGVVVEGHTDSIPISQAAGKRYIDNMELSFLRAKAVSAVLIQNGVPSGRISVIGRGDTQPVDTNETIEGRARNRRVVVRLVPEEKES